MSDKNRTLTFVLALVVGIFGVHRFYVGKIGTGVAMVLLDLTIVGMAVTGIWATVDCIIIAFGEFTDGDGLKITEW